MGFVKFLNFLRLQLICGSRIAGRVVDFGEDDGIDASLPCKPRKQKGMSTTFPWEEIQKLTMDFSVVIGYGGYSTVYLAQYPGPSSSTRAAVKIQCSSSERLNQAHWQELEILLHLQHPNIVKLIGHCNDTEEGILVMEYVPNGNLQEALHQGPKLNVGLSWKKRMAIAFQLGQAIEYLHDKCSLQIVHGDIKSSNVLLDEHLNCKLCDFGSAKMGFSSLVIPSGSGCRPNHKMVMVGSPGYTDPHYLRTGLASKKNDVYSFGVIVLELITGMEAFDPSSGQRLIMRAQPILQDVQRVVEMVDPRIRGELVCEEEAKVMAAISASCLADSPALRPCMSDILTNMRQHIPSAISHSKRKSFPYIN